MASLKIGDTVNIRYNEGNPEQKYRFRVTITEIKSPDEFVGYIDAIFAANRPGAPGEITGGEVHTRFRGKQDTFHAKDIVQ